MVYTDEPNKKSRSGAFEQTGRVDERQQTQPSPLLTVPTAFETPREALKLDESPSPALGTPVTIAG
jgi:hypothetical protein